MRTLILIILTALFSQTPSLVQARTFDCLDLDLKPALKETSVSSPSSDFSFRDTLPRTDVPQSEWTKNFGAFGPCPNVYPKVVFLRTIDQNAWSRIRVLAAAKKLIGVPYAHFHFPEMGGIDCSNFTTLAYNYALGIRFSSNIERQSREAGRKLLAGEKLQAGDLIFLYDSKRTRIAHVALYISDKWVIDSTETEVQIRPFAGRYKKDYAWARRIIE